MLDYKYKHRLNYKYKHKYLYPDHHLNFVLDAEFHIPGWGGGGAGKLM